MLDAQPPEGQLWLAGTSLPPLWGWLHHTLRGCSSEGILMRPEELDLLINSDTNFLLSGSSVLQRIDRSVSIRCRLHLKAQQPKRAWLVLYSGVKQDDISICTWRPSQLFASLLVNRLFRSICGLEVKWVKAIMIQCKWNWAFHCCSSAGTFLCGGNFRRVISAWISGSAMNQRDLVWRLVLWAALSSCSWDTVESWYQSSYYMWGCWGGGGGLVHFCLVSSDQWKFLPRLTSLHWWGFSGGLLLSLCPVTLTCGKMDIMSNVYCPNTYQQWKNLFKLDCGLRLSVFKLHVSEGKINAVLIIKILSLARTH